MGDADLLIVLQVLSGLLPDEQIIVVSATALPTEIGIVVDLHHATARRIIFVDSLRGCQPGRSNPMLACAHLWQPLVERRLTIRDLEAAGTLLGGGTWRVGAGMTSPFASGHRIEFVHPEKIAGMLDCMVAPVNASGCLTSPLGDGVVAFFDFLRIHPFVDGMGGSRECCCRRLSLLEWAWIVRCP